MNLNNQAASLGAFIDLSFIEGSTASVEQCLSIAKHILSDVCMGMSPYMFECFTFLHYNSDMWTTHEVKKAITLKIYTQRDEEDAKKHVGEA
jgi:hypothetical protein